MAGAPHRHDGPQVGRSSDQTIVEGFFLGDGLGGRASRRLGQWWCAVLCSTVVGGARVGTCRLVRPTYSVAIACLHCFVERKVGQWLSRYAARHGEVGGLSALGDASHVGPESALSDHGIWPTSSTSVVCCFADLSGRLCVCVLPNVCSPSCQGCCFLVTGTRWATRSVSTFKT